MVEFVIILPLFLMLIIGGITAALVYEHKGEVVHAVRDGARYGSTVPLGQCDTVAACGNRTWAELVQYVTSQRSAGALSGADVCVALVGGTSGAVFNRSGGVYATPASALFPTAGCFSDGNVDSGARVHVAAVHDGDRINLILKSVPATVTSNATARYEQ